MKICEQFNTLQGEGKFLGVPSHFIRTTGCNLRCAWKNKDGSVTKCDTPYASWKPEKGWELDVDQTILDLIDTNIKHIVITGGEPFLQKDLPEIVSEFVTHGFFVTIETNGTIFNNKLRKKNVFLSISPKLKSSYSQDKDSVERKIHTKNNTKENLFFLMQNYDFQLKFVVNNKEDFHEIRQLKLEESIPPNMIWIMPQGITAEHFQEKQKMMFDKCVELGYNYSPRMHIDVFGNKRGI